MRLGSQALGTNQSPNIMRSAAIHSQVCCRINVLDYEPTAAAMPKLPKCAACMHLPTECAHSALHVANVALGTSARSRDVIQAPDSSNLAMAQRDSELFPRMSPPRVHGSRPLVKVSEKMRVRRDLRLVDGLLLASRILTRNGAATCCRSWRAGGYRPSSPKSSTLIHSPRGRRDARPTPPQTHSKQR